MGLFSKIFLEISEAALRLLESMTNCYPKGSVLFNIGLLLSLSAMIGCQTRRTSNSADKESLFEKSHITLPVSEFTCLYYDKASILKELDPHQKNIQDCFEQESSGSKFDEPLRSSWYINSAGVGFDLQFFEEDKVSSLMASCIRGKIAAVTFPKPPKGPSPRVIYTFRDT